MSSKIAKEFIKELSLNGVQLGAEAQSIVEDEFELVVLRKDMNLALGLP